LRQDRIGRKGPHPQAGTCFKTGHGQAPAWIRQADMTSVAEIKYCRALVFHEAGNFPEALAAFDVALMTAPHVAAIHYGRGNSLAMLRRLEEAVDAYGKCLALEPGHVPASYNLAMAFTQLQRWQDALAVLDGVVQRNPTMADAWNNRSGVLQALGRHEDALQSAQQVLKLRPFDARTFYNAGIILLILNRFDEAQQALTKALEIDPAHGDALGCLASAALRSCDWDTLERIHSRLFSAVRDGAVAVPPLTLLALSDDPELQRRCAELATKRSLAEAAMDGIDPAPMATPGYHHGRIRIGYLSSDFRNHPVAAQVVGLLEKHDRSRFEIIGLFTGAGDASSLHHRIVRACDNFLSIGDIGSREAAARIRELEIDILVDLNGHTMGWRPAVLKQRPASVIATFLGYAGTTGAPFVDYIIGDPQVTPFDQAAAMSESIVQLPACFWPSDPMLPEPEPVSRAEAGLPQDAFVFCCFNSNHKIRPQMFDIWARLLGSVPGSVLWIRDGGPAMNERFRQQARVRNIDAKRIVFAGRMESFARHLGRQVQADLFLDTYPYNAHATASDALWAGLPVVTLRGRSFVSRVTASLLINVRLDELIASTLEDYEAIALSLALDRGRLSDMRRRLAGARTTASLFDMDRFVSGIESAYTEMHARAQRGESPSALKVSTD
jgi:protein O-GlcNAc transferase